MGALHSTRRLRRSVVVCVAALSCALASACAGKKGAARVDVRPASMDEVEIPLVLDDGTSTALPADLSLPAGDGVVPFVLVVPGGGNVSRRGTRTGDGEIEYGDAIHTSHALAALFVEHGFATLAWDKRTCGPRDDPACDKQPLDDVEREGPRALAKDVDAACAFARSHPRAGPIVLWAHGQAAQVALTSTCAADAAAVVLVAPPPRRIDQVLVDGMIQRAKVVDGQAKKAKGEEKKALTARAHDMRQRAAQLDETFKAVRAGKFPKDARLMGFPIPYWQGWLALTDEIPGGAPKPRVPWVVVLGERDVQFSSGDRGRIQKLGALPQAQGFVVKGADHHLLRKDEGGRMGVDEAAWMPILEALHAATGTSADTPGEV